MSSSDSSKANRLQHSSSPYLLQHAHNPVDWYEWGDEAFERAEAENKPVFLSIGYSTCHWCHVMERESFEDDEVAALMNDAFINIKVDREERPDIDSLYMSVCQMMSPSCGWPLTVLLTPERKPFYVTTYVPKDDARGRPGMLNLVPAIAEAWQSRRDEIDRSIQSILDNLNASQSSSGSMLTLEDCHTAVKQFQQSFDEEHGGFGTRPKFPSPHNLLFLARHSTLFRNPASKAMVEKTLTSMRMGGIWDHIGFGFHRYSTDQIWLLPHFEKMLYDQAMLMLAYTEGWKITEQPLLQETTTQICEYLRRDMAHPDGGYYSAEDADSEGEEGKFYVWTIDELRNQLSGGQFRIAVQVYGAVDEGTYIEEATGERTGANILHESLTRQEHADALGLTAEELEKELEDIRRKLLESRAERVRPGLDDKILTDWNGLVLWAFAEAAFSFADNQMLDDAERLAGFLLNTMRKKDGSLHHRFRNGEAGIDGFLDDYVFTARGLISLFTATADPGYLQAAKSLMDTALDLLWDGENHGFFFSSENPDLIVRKKEIYDGAIPSGNAVAVEVLFLLSVITGEKAYSDRAVETITAFSGEISKHPAAFSQTLNGVLAMYRGNREIVITSSSAEGAEEMLATLRNRHLPATTILPVIGPDSLSELQQINELFSGFEIPDSGARAYVCENFSCREPVDTVDGLISILPG